MNKYDFIAIVSATNANPNGDPLNGNRPRINIDGLGEISDVALKRKIRNRLQDMGERIFVQSEERTDDGFKSLNERAKSTLKFDKSKSSEEYEREACKAWIDVRSFGQVFAIKGASKGSGESLGIRGPVSIHPAFSLDPVTIEEIQITKSVNSETTDGKKSSDTMGMKHRVNFGLYLVKGSISPQLAEKTGFDDDDAEKIHKSLISLFENDSSSARPEGSMVVERVYWFKHNNKSGQYSTANVHKSVKISKVDPNTDPRSIDDYRIEYDKLDNLEVDIFEG